MSRADSGSSSMKLKKGPGGRVRDDHHFHRTATPAKWADGWCDQGSPRMEGLRSGDLRRASRLASGLYKLTPVTA